MKTQKKKLEDRKSRDAKRKRKRLATEAARNVLTKARRSLRADVNLIALNRPSDDEVLIGVRQGVFGHPGNVLLRVDYTSVVGCVEDKAELGKLVNNLGILALSQLIGYNLAEGLDNFGKAFANWAQIDLEELVCKAKEGEQGYREDLVVQPAEEQPTTETTTL